MMSVIIWGFTVHVHNQHIGQRSSKLVVLFQDFVLFCTQINQSDDQVVIQDMIGLCVPCGTKS